MCLYPDTNKWQNVFHGLVGHKWLLLRLCHCDIEFLLTEAGGKTSLVMKFCSKLDCLCYNVQKSLYWHNCYKWQSLTGGEREYACVYFSQTIIFEEFQAAFKRSRFVTLEWQLSVLCCFILKLLCGWDHLLWMLGFWSERLQEIFRIYSLGLSPFWLLKILSWHFAPAI